MSSIVNTTAPVAFDPATAGESNLGRILGVQTAVHALALVFVTLRVYARVFVVKAFGKDDACMVLAALCGIGGWAAFMVQAGYGLGKHQQTISMSEMIVFQHAGFWQSVIGTILALCFLKLSIGFGLLRLSTHKWYSWALWSTMGVVVAYSVMGVCTFFFHCTPMAAHWDTTIKGAYCYPLPLFITFALVNTSFNIATDVLFASFPVPVVWNLQMKRKIRIYLVGIMSLGYFAVIFGILKAVFQIAYSRDPDKTFNQWVQFWGFLQLNTGIIAACAATLKPLVTRILRLGSTNERPSYANDRYTPHGPRSRGARAEKLSGSQHDDDLDEFEMAVGGTQSGKRESAIIDGTVAVGRGMGLAPVMIKGGLSSGPKGTLYEGDEGSSREKILHRPDGIVVAHEVKVMRTR